MNLTVSAQLRNAVVALALGAVLIGCGMLPMGSEIPREVPVVDAKSFYETTSIFGASFAPDEQSVLITSDESGVFNVYRQPITGGAPVQLTSSTTDSIMGRGYFPNDTRFLYSADEGGNELTHLYVQEENGTKKDLTPGKNLKASFMGWTGDKKHFWVQTNERDPKFFDLYRYATDGYSRELVYKNEEGYFVSSVSRDEKWVALGKPRNNVDSDIYLWNVGKGGKPVHVTAHEGNVVHSALTFSPDSNHLYYSTNEHGEFSQAWTYDIQAQTRRSEIEADWDVNFVYFSENGRYRVSGVNANAQTEVTVHDTKSGKSVPFPRVKGEVRGVSISPSEDTMAFYVNWDTAPSNLHVLNLDTFDFRRLTDTLNPKILGEDLVEGRDVTYKSFDELDIPAILYRPWPASEFAPTPALVYVHGGPGGQSRHGYNATIQHLVNHGYAVLAVNNRGSSGYGKTFFHMDDLRHGDVDLKDCIWARKYLEGISWVDSNKIGIIGGSYGGYMVAAALAFEPEAFEVGVDIFGVTNWLRTLKSIPPWWSAQREALYTELGDPDEEEERLRAISPLFHASNIVRPLLVIQGANDPRVLQVESDELVQAVEKNGVPVEYVIFPDEGHGFRRRENRITASEAYVRFLNKHLKRTATP